MDALAAVGSRLVFPMQSGAREHHMLGLFKRHYVPRLIHRLSDSDSLFSPEKESVW